MAVTGVNYREVCVSVKQNWKDITVPICDGESSVGYLHEHKSVSRAGGYGYNDSASVNSPCRNRFIYWRYSQGDLELVEESLDYSLKGNALRLHFTGAALVGDVNIHESHGSVVILITTTATVHRLNFPHPNKLQKYDSSYLYVSGLSIPSIFTDVSVSKITTPGNCHNFNVASVSATYQIHASSSCLTKDGEAIFALATSHGTVLLVKLPPHGIQGIPTQCELKQSSVMQRLWSGFVPSLIRGGTGVGDCTSGLVLHAMGQDVFVFAVSKDHKLRMWSCKDYDCVMAADLLEFMPYNASQVMHTIKEEGHVIRKAFSNSRQILYLGVFLSFSAHHQFSVFEPVFVDGRYQLNHITDVFGTQDDLIDFCLTDNSLWMLWSSSHGDVYASQAFIEYKRTGINNMHTVIRETNEPTELCIPGHLEPREYYIEQIFSPGRFNTLTIFQALNIFIHSGDNIQVLNSVVPLEALKAEVLAAIEQEVQDNASDYSVTDEEYQNLQLQQWAKFYSCCVQYHERSIKPLGLFVDVETGMVSVVKKDTRSFYRPCCSIEYLSLTETGECSIETLHKDLILHEDETVLRDVVDLCDCLKLIGECLTDEIIYSFEQDLYHNQDPITVANSIATWLINNNDCNQAERQVKLDDAFIKLQHVEYLDGAIECLMMLLDLTNKEQEAMMDDAGTDTSRQLSLSRLFSSDVGVSVLSRAVHQVAQCHLDVSRDLLLLLTLMMQMTEQAAVTQTVLEKVESEFLSKACLLVQIYYMMKWSTEVMTAPCTANQVETNMQMLEALGLLENIRPVSYQNMCDNKDARVMEHFLRMNGGVKVKEILSENNLFDENPCQFWTKAIPAVIRAVLQIIWPYNNYATLPMFLLGRCQYTVLQEYVRLTQDWCDLNNYTHSFLLGLVYFSSGEVQKAVDCFLKVPLDVTSEDFLCQLVMAENSEDYNPRMVYYLKVLDLLEQFHYPHLAVSVAKNAINASNEDSDILATLWSKVFKNELELGHNEDAYTAMLSNPDKDRRRDCLRQFLVVLCERSDLETLVTLDYRDRHVVLEEEVVSILESRARSIDLNKHNYYDLLYSFHILRHNYRKAGSIMYEYGIRQGREISGLKGLQKQAKCYLAALNALRLVSPEYAWIVKPLPPAADMDQTDKLTSKRDHDGNEFKFSKKCQVHVLDLDDIFKEYILVHSRLQLLQACPDPGYMAGPTLNAPETVALLVNSGLFDSAVNICKIFKLSLAPVFESLTLRCLTLAENTSTHILGDNQYTAEAWKWLQHNELVTANAVQETSATDHAWRLLRNLLSKYEDGTGIYHKCIAVKLLTHGFPLPTWLQESYKKLDVAALLRLYLDYNMLEEAAYLTLEYIDAVLGKGMEFFDVKTSLHVGGPPVWLPYTSIDQLIAALDEEQTQPFIELSECIQDKLDVYFNELKRVSDDTLRAHGNVNVT